MTIQRAGVKYHLVPGECHDCAFYHCKKEYACPYYTHGKVSGFLKCCYGENGEVRIRMIWKPLTEAVKDV